MKPEIQFTQLFINNEFVPAASGRTFATIDPSDETEVARIAEADAEDVDRAVEAARAAFSLGSPWRTMDASDRGRLMQRLVQLMIRDKEQLARLDTVDNGKTLSDSRGDIEQSISTLEYYAGYADKIHGDTIPADGAVVTMTRSGGILQRN